jgi:DNA-directed RNA polymerase specialized sigma24 family protein
MQKQQTYPSFEELSDGSEQSWSQLYASLRSPVTMYVHMYAAPTWIEQRYDLIEDIIQEIAMRMFRQTQLNDTNEGTTIRNIESFCHIMVRNYCRDLWRKEKRVSFFPKDTYAFDASIIAYDLSEDPLEATLDDLTTNSVLVETARIIADFPERQRTALLIDLARYNDFGNEPTLLEKVLARVGISLRAYRGALPQNPVERGRHNASLSYAYKRLRLTYHAEYADVVA